MPSFGPNVALCRISISTAVTRDRGDTQVRWEGAGTGDGTLADRRAVCEKGHAHQVGHDACQERRSQPETEDGGTNTRRSEPARDQSVYVIQ